jgi:hypothetical protein
MSTHRDNFARDNTKLQTCGLEVKPLGTFADAAQVVALLQGGSAGWYTTATAVLDYVDGVTGWVLDAEVAFADRTVVVRHDGGQWGVWEWRETPGTTHRCEDELFATTAPSRTGMRYRTYWVPRAESGSGAPAGAGTMIDVWRPVGARFLGWT